MYKALQLPRESDTRALRQALWAHRIGHRVTEEGDLQIVWLADPAQHDEMLALLERWQRGEPLPAAAAQKRAPPSVVRGAFMQAPLTALLIAACLVVFGLLAAFGDAVVLKMTIVPVVVAEDQLWIGNLMHHTLGGGEVWRLLSPALLHFGWMHLIFNMLWLWYFGRQIEALQGKGRLLLVVILGALLSNLAQYATGTVLFGGMSGVDYALLGYVWLMSRRLPESGFFVPQMLVVFMLIWMVFTMTDVAGVVGFGNVANEAHLGGLLVGLALGWVASRRRA
ncbi:rhomboid family intramembrane serine protease [Halomonas shantousis]